MSEKMWGAEPYYGLGYDFDPQWLLNDEQKKIQKQLIALCESTLRPNAVEFDKTKEYPRKNLEALASIGLMGLLIPKELGGLGQNHVCAAMVLETIGRYGCPSTCLVYTMHLLGTAGILFRAKGNKEIESVLKRVNPDCFVGTAAYSDPETGSHFWYPKMSSAQETAKGWKVNKKSSWTTSGGFADFYITQTTSPNFKGDYSDLSVFLIYKDEVKANPAVWDAMGMRGNQSGPIEIKDVEVPKDRMVGPPGDGALSNDEVVDPFALALFAASYNGMALGMIDLAKKQVTRKTHSDVGMRVCDYPTIQDYFGECIMDTQASRAFTFQICQALDRVTNDCDWSIHWNDPKAAPRAQYLSWLWQLKFTACKNVYHVGDKMLHACGGTGFKKELGLERIFRDSRAGWVMGPTNEVLRQFVGKYALLGFESLDYWNQVVNERVINNELKKLDADGKKKLIARLQSELAQAAE